MRTGEVSGPAEEGVPMSDSRDELEPGAESFPASDPPEGWAGPDRPPPDADGARRDDAHDVADPIPEADDEEVADAWEVEDPMGGPSPTG
jgi:hypothetical protein